jgi:Mg-chelatase subunit ChlD
VPLLWWLSFHAISGLGRYRRWLALLARSAVLTLLILALAGAQLVRRSDRLTVMFVLDHSLSVSEEQTTLAREYINRSIETQRKAGQRDRAGLIVFGREASIELPPVVDPPTLGAIESLVDREYSNLSGALRLAQAAFPYDAAKRVVILSDGNENIGSVAEQAQVLTDADVGIDVVPLRTALRGDVAVEKLALPTDVRKGENFDLRVVLNNTSVDGKPRRGKLQIYRRAADRETPLSEEEITLPPGRRVMFIRDKIDQPEFYTYEARFVPEKPGEDGLPQNNQATAFTHVRGSGQVLFLEDFEHRGEYDYLIERLRANNLEVTLRSSRPEELFGDLAQLQPFDTVVLANVPREHLSDEQIEMLVRNTQNMGAGLVMLGSPTSFGAGGWTNTPLEEAMPVDFEIKNVKVKPAGALALVIDRSGSMHGEKLAMARAAAMAAVDVLSPKDYVSISAFDTEAQALVPMIQVKNRAAIKSRAAQLTVGGGTYMEPGIKMGYDSFRAAKDAAVKHMVILTDGQTDGTGYERMAAKFRSEGITVSTVAVGTDADQKLLQRMAVAGGGKYYNATSPKVLPRIFQTEARVISRPLVFEDKNGMTPRRLQSHEINQGVASVLPPITGYVMTQVKENPLVELLLENPKPSLAENRTLLASWTYGLGRTVAFTTDVGKRWANTWTQWDQFDKLFSQMIRWSMRPVDEGKFLVATDAQDGIVQLVVTALDKDDTFLNFLQMGGAVLGPDMKPLSVTMRQTAPGRYVGEFAAKDKGSYFVMLSPGAGRAPLRVGVNIPYSDEFRERETNEALLTSLAQLEPKRGKPGQVIETAETAIDLKRQVDKLLAFNPFRHDLPPATSSQDLWPWLTLAACVLFFGDVLVRRVQINFLWVPVAAQWVWSRMRRTSSQPTESPVLERLRSKKVEVGQSFQMRQAATRFEPTADGNGAAAPDVAARATTPRTTAPQSTTPSLAANPAPQEEGYTSRLLKAKQQVWNDRKPDNK